jgi:uncharacterized protein YbjT (DUF2867 family)
MRERQHPTMGTFLIIGGTGKVGSRLTQILRAGGHTARVASRTGGDVRFDWRDPASYGGALAGADGIFVVGPGSATDWSQTLTAMLDVAAEQKVSRAVLLSARGVEFLPDGAVARAERAIKAGPLGWTILRPSHFAQNFTEAMFVPVDGAVVAPVADGAEPFIDVEDIAQVAAAALTDGRWNGEVLELSGPSALTFTQAVGILSSAMGTELRFDDEEPDLHTARLIDAGTPAGYVEWRMAMLGGIRSGRDAYLSDGVQRVLGRPATSFSAWADREAAAPIATT